MTTHLRPARLGGLLLATLTALLPAAAASASAPPPGDTPTVQVVLPVVDGGITVVVAPGTPSAAPAAPAPGAAPTPAPPTVATIPEDDAPPVAFPGQTAPAATTAATPAPAPPADTPAPDHSAAAPDTTAPTTAPTTTASPTTAPASPSSVPSTSAGTDRTWGPLPTARPTYVGGGTTPPSTTPGSTTPGTTAPGSTAPDSGTERPTTSTGTPSTGSTAPRTGGAAPASRADGGFHLGVFAHSKDRVERFQQKVGRPVDVLGVFPARGSWDTIMDTWWLDTAPEGFHGTLDVGVPLWQDDGDLETAAAGGYDAEWEKLGRTIEARYPGSSVRIGWEFNLGGWKHHASEENVEQWKKAFRSASTALKRGGPSLLVSWNPNKGRGDALADASKAWPGDDVVDIVALDAYDWWPAYSESTWPEHRDGDQGWAYWVNFARTHGKKFAVPEWGVAPGNDHGGGDNPYYIGVVVDFLAAEQAKDGIVHSIVYFDEPESYIANSIADGQVPLAGEALAGRLAALPSSSGSSPTGRTTGGSGGSRTGAGSSGTSDDATTKGAGAEKEPAESPTPSNAPGEGGGERSGQQGGTDDQKGAEDSSPNSDRHGDDHDATGHEGGKDSGSGSGSGSGTSGASESRTETGPWSAGDGHGPVPR